jgi:hypothetical protein
MYLVRFDGKTVLDGHLNNRIETKSKQPAEWFPLRKVKWECRLDTGDGMNSSLLKSVVALIPTGVLFAGAVATFSRERTTGSILQLLGSGFLVIVVLLTFPKHCSCFAG